MKFTVTYTLEVTEIHDDSYLKEEDFAEETPESVAEFAKDMLLADHVIAKDYKYFVHEERGQ